MQSLIVIEDYQGSMGQNKRISDQDVFRALQAVGQPARPMDVVLKLGLTGSDRNKVIYHLRKLVETGGVEHDEAEGIYWLAEGSDLELKLLREVGGGGVPRGDIVTRWARNGVPRGAVDRMLDKLIGLGHLSMSGDKVTITPGGAWWAGLCFRCGRDWGTRPLVMSTVERYGKIEVGDETVFSEELGGDSSNMVDMVVIHASCSFLNQEREGGAIRASVCAYCGLPIALDWMEPPRVTYQRILRVFDREESRALLSLDIATEHAFEELEKQSPGKRLELPTVDGPLESLVSMVLPKRARIRERSLEELVAAIRIRVFLQADLSYLSGAQRLCELITASARRSSQVPEADRAREIWQAASSVYSKDRDRLERARDLLQEPVGSIYSMMENLCSNEDLMGPHLWPAHQALPIRTTQALVMHDDGRCYHPSCYRLQKDQRGQLGAVEQG